MAIHIGEELRKRLKASGVPVTRFAKRIGCSAKTVHALFKRPSMDTMLLKRCSEELAYDFFALYSEDLRTRGTPRSMASVSEPGARYSLKGQGDEVEIVIRSGKNKELVERVLKALEGRSTK